MKNLLTALAILSLITFSGCSQTASVKKDVQKAKVTQKVQQSNMTVGAQVMSEKEFMESLKSKGAIKK